MSGWLNGVAVAMSSGSTTGRRPIQDFCAIKLLLTLASSS